MKLTPSAEAWMFKHSISPKSWKIPPDELERIDKLPATADVYEPPGGVLDRSKSPASVMGGRLVSLDKSYLERGNVTKEQQIGIILHEIGHIVNQPQQTQMETYEEEMHKQDGNNKQATATELYADYYVHYCGYGRHYAAAMRVMKVLDVYGFDTDAVTQRLAELDNTPRERLNLK